jgi:fucose permease
VTFFLSAVGTGLQDAQANTFVASVKAAHRWLAVIHASYMIGCLVGPLVATAIASNRPQSWALFYSIPLGLGVLNLMLVWLSFRGDILLRKSAVGDVENEETSRARTAWNEMKETIGNKTVWLLSLFYFFYLGVGITIGGKLDP